MKNIAVSIVNRTNYSKIKPVLLELKKSDNVKINIVVSSSLLLDRYANAYKDIEKDFVISKKINCLLSSDSLDSMVQTSALSMMHHSEYFRDNTPDLLLVVGDRYDMFPVVLSASMMNIPIAHIQGGEKSGSIDDKIRDMITRLSTLHFVSTDFCAKRVIEMGADKNYVFNVGCPAIEYINSIDVGDGFNSLKLGKTFKHCLDIKYKENYVIFLLHPDTTNPYDVGVHKVLDVLTEINIKSFIFYPNVDANNYHIIESINQYKENPNFYFIKHIPLEGYIHLLAHSVCIIGNSSSGIREAASFGVPTINLGTRQCNREKNENVVDILADSSNDIKYAITECIRNKGLYSKNNIYYKRDCSKTIASEIVKYLTKY